MNEQGPVGARKQEHTEKEKEQSVLTPPKDSFNKIASSHVRRDETGRLKLMFRKQRGTLIVLIA